MLEFGFTWGAKLLRYAMDPALTVPPFGVGVASAPPELASVLNPAAYPKMRLIALDSVTIGFHTTPAAAPAGGIGKAAGKVHRGAARRETSEVRLRTARCSLERPRGTRTDPLG